MLYTATAWALNSRFGAHLLQATVPDVDPQEPPGLKPYVDLLLGWYFWIAIVLAAPSLAYCGTKMYLAMNGRTHAAAAGAAGIPWVLGGLTLVLLSTGIVSGVVAISQ